jgi:hypothetical protein
MPIGGPTQTKLERYDYIWESPMMNFEKEILKTGKYILRDRNSAL